MSERTPASFVLSSPEMGALRIAVPAGATAPADYACVSVLPGRPAAQLVEVLTADMPGYVAEN